MSDEVKEGSRSVGGGNLLHVWMPDFQINYVGPISGVSDYRSWEKYPFFISAFVVALNKVFMS